MGPDRTHWRPLRELSCVTMKLLSVITERSRLGDVPEAWRKAPLPKRPWVLLYNKLHRVSSVSLEQRWPNTPRAVLAQLQVRGRGPSPPRDFDSLSVDSLCRVVDPRTRERLTNGKEPMKGHQADHGTGREAEGLSFFVLKAELLRG